MMKLALVCLAVASASEMKFEDSTSACTMTLQDGKLVTDCAVETTDK
jgi:hypothetical protein